jgi:hypothetical protein
MVKFAFVAQRLGALRLAELKGVVLAYCVETDCVIEGEIAVPVILPGKRNTQRGGDAAHGFIVERLVIENDAIEVKNDSPKHDPILVNENLYLYQPESMAARRIVVWLRFRAPGLYLGKYIMN